MENFVNLVMVYYGVLGYFYVLNFFLWILCVIELLFVCLWLLVLLLIVCEVGLIENFFCSKKGVFLEDIYDRSV